MEKQERIVLIDDSSNDAGLTQRILQRAGYDVRWASSGEEGLVLTEQVSPHCILVDYRMPGIDGYEVCRRIKSNPATQNIPVLMLTGANTTQNLVEGLEAGADDFVTKGSEIEVILARVRALLRVKAYQDRIVEQAEQLRILYDELSIKSEKIMGLNQRLNKDLQIARRVQEALLPDRVFAVGGVQIRSTYIPSETLSGDFYDYFVSEGNIYVFLGDVSGHGLAASILVSLLKSFLHSEVTQTDSLPAFMANLNDFLFSASLPAQYATAQLFRFNPDTNKLAFANAAHPPFMLYHRAGRNVTFHDKPGHLLGALTGMTFDEFEITVQSGDLLFCYTDGLTDRRTEGGEFYAAERIAHILETSDSADLDETYERIHEDITSFRPTEEFKDDIAFILTRF